MISTNSTHPAAPESSQSNPPPPDELEQLAAMTGYSLEASPGKTKLQTATIPKPLVPPTETDGNDDTPLLDTEDLAETEPTDAKTKTPLWSNPLAKAGFVTALMGVAIGTVGIFLWSVNGNWNSQLAQQPKSPTPAITPSPTTDPQQAEVGRLKTVAALGSQAQTLRQNAKNPTALPRNMPTKAVKPTTSVETPARPNPTVVYSPPQSYASPVTPPPQSSIATRTQPAGLSYESSRGMAHRAGVRQFRANQRIESVWEECRADSIAQRRSTTISLRCRCRSVIVRCSNSCCQNCARSDRHRNLKDPIIWAQDLKSNQQPQRFGLELTQPLRAADGMVALPTGTQMIAKVDAVSGSGLVELSVGAIVVPTNQGNRVVNVPTGAIFVAGQDGSPLMAGNYTNTHMQLLGKDIGIALMGALGQVGTLLNRPLNESTTTSPYLSSTNVSNGRTNILGGLLQGGFGGLQNQVSQRQQQDVQAILNRPNVWYIPSDRPVQVFINSPFEVRL